MILIDSVFKIGKNCYPKVFLKEFKYIVKEKGVTRYLTEDLEISSNLNESDEE